MDYDTVRLDDDNNAVVIIDQTKLPGAIEIISLKTAEEIWNAIYLLQVRGAPAIGVAVAQCSNLLCVQVNAGLPSVGNEKVVAGPVIFVEFH